MNRTIRELLLLYPRGGLTAYQKRVLASDPIAYWPLDEKSGTVARCLVNVAQNGAYARDVATMGTGPGIEAGATAPLFGGSNDYVQAYTATLASAFNGKEGAIIEWFKVGGIGVWTDGADRRMITILADGSNYLMMRKDSMNDTYLPMYRADGTTSDYVHSPVSPTTWMPIGMSWSDADDEVIYFYDDTTLETDSPIPVWSGAPANNRVTIGAGNVGPAQPWSGYLSNIALYDEPMTLAQFQVRTVI